MYDFDDEELELMVRYVCKKYRDEIAEDFEKNLCIEHYNQLFRLQLSVDDVETMVSECKLCNEEKVCVVHPLRKR